jgi:hypothetical protein
VSSLLFSWISSRRDVAIGPVPLPSDYDPDMGLFRNRAKKIREKVAAELLTEQTSAVAAPVEVAPRKVIAEARPDPDQPGWGRALGQAIGKAREDRASQE